MGPTSVLPTVLCEGIFETPDGTIECIQTAGYIDNSCRLEQSSTSFSVPFDLDTLNFQARNPSDHRFISSNLFFGVSLIRRKLSPLPIDTNTSKCDELPAPPLL